MQNESLYDDETPDETESEERKELIKSLETSKEEALATLDKDYPHNEKLITANDLFNLSITNAAIAMEAHFTSDTEGTKEATLAALQQERDAIVFKVTQIVADIALADALRYPKVDYISRGAAFYSDLLDKLQPGEEADADDDYDYSYNYVNYDNILDDLRLKLRTRTADEKEVSIALQLTQEITKYPAWYKVAKLCQDIQENGADVGSVEELLQQIHQGDFEVDALAKEASRPMLDHMTDRPWEAANVLTYTFAGFPKMSRQRIRPAVLTALTPYRELPGIKNYFSDLEPSIEKLSGATRGLTFLQASLSLSTEIPIEEAMYYDYFMDGDAAKAVIEYEDNE